MAQTTLLIDPRHDTHTLLRAHLAGEPLSLYSAFDADAGLQLTHQLQPDLIIVALETPPDGLALCAALKANPDTLATPILLLTAPIPAEQKLHALDLGVADFLISPFDAPEARARVRSALRDTHLTNLLSRKAMIDGLTGLWNQAYLRQRLEAEVGHVIRTGRGLACILLNLDGFKAINERHGHPRADELLRAVAQLLVDQCRVEDVVCRFDGDTFAVLTPGIGAVGASALAERLRLAIADAALPSPARAIPLTASFGVGGTDALPPSSLLPAAQHALKRAKQTARNTVVIADSAQPALA